MMGRLVYLEEHPPQQELLLDLSALSSSGLRDAHRNWKETVQGKYYKTINMYRITLIVFLLFTTIISAQEVYLESGKTFASFDFTDSQGNTLDNLQPNANHYLAFGYRNGILFDNLYASAGISLFGYGAIGSDDGLGNFMEWDVNYIDFNGAVDYEIVKVGDFAFYVKGQLALAFMVQGNQTINNQVIKLERC